jgi:hypothetical protein
MLMSFHTHPSIAAAAKPAFGAASRNAVATNGRRLVYSAALAWRSAR